MKRLLTLLAAGALFSGIALSAGAATITFDEFVSSPAAQDTETTPLYYDNPIKDEYAALGVHFKSGPETPDEISSVLAAQGLPSFLYGGDIFNFIGAGINWPGSNFPVLPPETQFLGLDKAPGIEPTTGIVVEYDNFSTHLSFECRRPGNSLDSETVVNIVIFNTAQAEWVYKPIYVTDISAYVDPSKHGISDEDGWLAFSEELESPFNMVLLFSNKKFAIDNLSFPLVLDFNHDGDVDGGDLVDFVSWFGSTMDEEDLSEFAAKFGNSDAI